MRNAVVAVTAFALELLTVPALAFVYLDAGAPPVAVTDPAFPLEKSIASSVLPVMAFPASRPHLPAKCTPSRRSSGRVIVQVLWV